MKGLTNEIVRNTKNIVIDIKRKKSHLTQNFNSHNHVHVTDYLADDEKIEKL